MLPLNNTVKLVVPNEFQEPPLGEAVNVDLSEAIAVILPSAFLPVESNTVNSIPTFTCNHFGVVGLSELISKASAGNAAELIVNTPAKGDVPEKVAETAPSPATMLGFTPCCCSCQITWSALK